ARLRVLRRSRHAVCCPRTARTGRHASRQHQPLATMLCLVTDRRRLTSADTSAADAGRCLVEQARHAVEAGIDLIQRRERDLGARDLAALTRELLAVTRSTPTRLLVND